MRLRLAARPTVLALAAALACAAPAQAYTYTVLNGTGKRVTQIWLHTQSVFCHDVTWRGSLPNNGQVKISTANICLVDRIEVLGGASQSWPTGHATGYFLLGPTSVCYTSTVESVMSRGFSTFWTCK